MKKQIFEKRKMKKRLHKNGAKRDEMKKISKKELAVVTM